MVSIFADNIYNETITATLDDGAIAGDELSNKLAFPDVDISSTIGGFTYVETVTLSFQLSAPITVELFSTVFGNRRTSVSGQMGLVFNNALDLFTDLSSASFFSGEQGMDNNPGVETVYSTDEKSELITVDKYIDTPSVATFDLSASFSSIDRVEIEGNQTVTATAKIDMVGRQP